MRKKTISKSSELIVKVHSRCFAFQIVHVKVVQEGEGKDRFRSVNRGRIKAHAEELEIKGLGILTGAESEAMLKDTCTINSAENKVLRSMRFISRTRAAIMSKVNDVSKTKKGGWGKELAIPKLNSMKRGTSMIG
jgi:hypothetical protein